MGGIMATHMMKNQWFFIITHMLIMCLSVPLVQSQIGSPGLEVLRFRPLTESAGLSRPEASLPQTLLKAPEQSMVDRQAVVIALRGEVRCLEKNGMLWRTLHPGRTIRAGDQIRTGKHSHVLLSYDRFHLNIVVIQENSLAEFRSIEPTQIYITQGEVYSSLDGLPSGASYQVITPTSVGGVRGTRFIRAFDPQTKTDTTIVTEGRVDLIFGSSEAGVVKGLKKVPATAGQILEFGEHQTARGALQMITTRKIPRGQEKALRNLHRQSQKELAGFLGGKKTVKRLQKKWRASSASRAALSGIHAALEENTKELRSPLLTMLTGPQTGSDPRKTSIGAAGALQEKNTHPKITGKKAQSRSAGTFEPNGQEADMVVTINLCEKNPAAC